ncbi:hypothetical protein EUGRSUZ_C03888 [Eucalyptus grandis]|uniref:Uncharacterized protein n=2 Tax=Eucalyptus grandis TaxID=71139 RepID=A0ACC3LJD6_EUCGR|nr:hypothetical protein EUGRSUZ_C03888 [Eucalyptus grandis]
MTTYGTIPSASSPLPSSNLEFISHAKARIRTGLATRRPWKEMFRLSAMAPPDGLGASVGRIQTNVTVFRMNYTVIVLTILFLSLLWHPVSLIAFMVMMILWLFLYFLRGSTADLVRPRHRRPGGDDHVVRVHHPGAVLHSCDR